MPSVKPLLVGALLLAAAAGPAIAEVVIEDAIRIARDNGMTYVREAELDDGKWEIEGRDADGRELEIDVDASDGRVIRIERD